MDTTDCAAALLTMLKQQSVKVEDIPQVLALVTWLEKIAAGDLIVVEPE